MKLLHHLLLAGFITAVALLCGHGTALADSCTLTAPATLGNLIANYDPTAASNSYVIPANTIQATCTFSATSTNNKVRILFLGISSTQTNYTPPVLNGPNGSQLAFQICPTSAACSSGFWNATTPIEFDGLKMNSTNNISVGQLAVYVQTAQNDYVGSYGAINVYFAFTCGHGSTFTTC